MSCYVAPAPVDATGFVQFLDFLQGKEKHALGFLPFTALRQAIELGRVLLCFENDEPAGYAIHGVPKAESKIYQVVVCDDVRRIEHGTALVEAITARANAADSEILSLHCAEDLDANSFWKALGFTQTGKRCRRKDGKRLQNRYEITLPGRALALRRDAEKKAQINLALERDGLTKLRNLLVKNSPNIATVSMTRKLKKKHEIFI